MPTKTQVKPIARSPILDFRQGLIRQGPGKRPIQDPDVWCDEANNIWLCADEVQKLFGLADPPAAYTEWTRLRLQGRVYDQRPPDDGVCVEVDEPKKLTPQGKTTARETVRVDRLGYMEVYLPLYKFLQPLVAAHKLLYVTVKVWKDEQ